MVCKGSSMYYVIHFGGLCDPHPPYCHQLSFTIILSYFDIPPLTFKLNINSAFIFNTSEITPILFKLITDPYMYARVQLRWNYKTGRLFAKFSLYPLICLHFFLLCHTAIQFSATPPFKMWPIIIFKSRPYALMT